MSEENKDKKPEAYCPPKGSITEHSTEIAGENIHYKAYAEWLVLRKKEKPNAEMFHIAYLAQDQDETKRPVTFVFNGGPGAASAYLHMGTMGPKRVVFNPDGTTPKPPAKVVSNDESWLSFTDLVFIDPIGTGFSRMIDEDYFPKKNSSEKSEKKSEKRDEKEYFKLRRDLESLGEFISKFLSIHKRWESPVFIAGESYGGYRTACLSRVLQEEYGVGLNGSIIISPALEFMPLDPSDYDLQAYIDEFPTFALAAAFHGKSKKFDKNTPIEEIQKVAEEFAANKMLKLLSQGDALSEGEREEIFEEMSGFTGIPKSYIRDSEGRMVHWVFSRKLLKEENRICGLYDASVTGVNPFPDREWEFGPGPTLSGTKRVFAAGINTQLRKHLKLESDRDYELLSIDANRSWENDEEQHFFRKNIGATDSLRYGMALNPNMKVFITHGFYDMVTPYSHSTRLVKQMRLDPSLKKNLTIRHFKGGHMFYTWEESRRGFRDEMLRFYKSAVE